MFHWFGTVTNIRGDSLPNWQVECVQVSDGATVVPIFSDENGTPIAGVSGIANRSVADENGNYGFFVPSGTYSLRFYNPSGTFQRLQRYLPMYGAPDPMPIRPQTSTAYTLVSQDAYTVVNINNANPVTLTVPADSVAAFPVGTYIEVHQDGEGEITVEGAAGVTVNSRDNRLTTVARHSVIGFRKMAANTWRVTGDFA